MHCFLSALLVAMKDNVMQKVRPMQLADINQVHHIELHAHRIPWSRDLLTDCVLVGYDARVLEIVNSSEPIIVGYIISRQQLNLYHILNLCISLPYQHQGFGKHLLQTVLSSLPSSELDTIMLEVRPSNLPAIALYESLGFFRDSIKPAYYKDEGSEEDALVLKKILQDLA